ncbi:CDP-diacylglycerol--glycerol-3-phosphate 3-phosphatidyltransferase, mitochondrial isoform X2 [Toxorhynchites rutilus septentrionalis]|uniref:CDP-diacylglycerol--glycerol-3-phosphate 3-phosphatidyltransferase, mitochondrial isoform X2 n=1 Tax=Toxorhynchites rutilus septentrionalis TaxID=329112 RepID=UPI0024799EBC|nr:CDP-diacylglycerol--glycerol-3-phosphate 3-phosphatidyltransferase, mitochondrial isoform X2 [Toxorhynchites rutilus septentrionalis]XP_055631214.1 CDP-diacylglycerol--glycerol-3-phosphate 3-phosphatidyltransferase, mitochondrial isoform X2 [Toxorhynchites rutilus septentrionalis]
MWITWQIILQPLFKMIRRLFSTLISDYPPVGEFLPTAPPSNNQRTNGGSDTSTHFRSSHLESLNWLHAASPCFPISGDRVEIIHEPTTFYNTLVAKCANAKQRIMLASLYLGIGGLETRLVNAIHQNMKNNARLKVDVLLDFTRGTRGEKNSKTTLMALLQESDNFQLSLYHTPVLRGLTKKLAPPRWNELLGIQHMKLYLVDDTVIISGANLSNDYFTNRQDRYVMIEDQRLANFYANFLEKAQEFSLKVTRDGETCLHENWKMLPYKSAQIDFATEARERIRNYFKGIMEQQKEICENDKVSDTWIFPLIEMGQLGIHHDSLVTKSLLSGCLRDSKLKLATGYFNLTETYMDTLTKACQAECSILMAHPNANGFLGAKGPAGGIPAAYSLIAKKFYEQLKKSGQNNRVSLLEYERTGWTYHAKGLWYYLPGSSLPNLTLIGSSNFGERSVNRDLEAQICLVTTNGTLQRKLQSEFENILQHSTKAEAELTARPVPRWVRAVVGLFRNFF